MKRSLAAAGILFMAGLALAQSRPAAQSPESVASLEAKLADLKQQVALVEAQLAAAKKTTAATQPALRPEDLELGLPANLKFDPKNTQRTRDDRTAWLKGKVVGRRIAGKGKVDIAVPNRLQISVLGQPRTYGLTVDNPPHTERYYTGDTIEFEGEVENAVARADSDAFFLIDFRIISVTPAPK